MSGTAVFMEIAEEVTRDIYRDFPELLDRFGERGYQKCIDDNMHHLNHLDTAYQVQDTKPFVDYAIWLNNVLTSRGMQTSLVIDNFERLDRIFEGRLPAEWLPFYRDCLQKANETLRKL